MYESAEYQTSVQALGDGAERNVRIVEGRHVTLGAQPSEPRGRRVSAPLSCHLHRRRGANIRSIAAALCFAVGAAFIVSDAPAQMPGSATTQEALSSEITRFFRDWFAAVEKGDPDGILELVDVDFVIKWPLGQPISDRERLREALAKVQQNSRQTVEWAVLEERVEPDWAWARVTEKATHVPKNGGEPRVNDGSHLVILRKVDGRWLLHRDYSAFNQMPRPPR